MREVTIALAQTAPVLDNNEENLRRMGNIIQRICSERPVAPSLRDERIPPWLDRLILKALAKRPEERYQNASEVLREGLRLIEERERFEEAKLKVLKQAARVGWADVSAGRYTDVADDGLEEFVGQLGRRAAQLVKTSS